MLILVLLFFTSFIFCVEDATKSISANPGAVDITTGTGALGRFIGFKEESGIRLGGLWIADFNGLAHGGSRIPRPKKLTGDSLFILDFYLDLYKFCGWTGSSFGIDYLRFDGQDTNTYAGVAQGYNSLPAGKPFHRSELYELWFRQAFFDEKLIIRAGKSVPTYDFNNVIRPVPTHEPDLSVPAVTSLIYTPIFVNSSILGVMPGYYNSAWGVTVTLAPLDKSYLSYGIYDGNLARGVQTGIKPGPTINNYGLSLLEGGQAWFLGSQKKPGMIAVGGWFQSGCLSTPQGITENGAQGFYTFGSQRLWFKNKGADSSGISAFYQFGFNNSITLPFPKFLGLGLTGFALVPRRPFDSLGCGMALAWLNPLLFNRYTECILQAYYQLHLVESSFFLAVLSYIPNPGINLSRKNAVAFTGRLIALF